MSKLQRLRIYIYKLRQPEREKSSLLLEGTPMPHVMIFTRQPATWAFILSRPLSLDSYLPYSFLNMDIVFSMSSKIRSWISLPQNQLLFLFMWNSAVSLHSQQEDSRMHNPSLAIIETMA